MKNTHHFRTKVYGVDSDASVSAVTKDGKISVTVSVGVFSQSVMMSTQDFAGIANMLIDISRSVSQPIIARRP